eukprot:3722083-Pleurochrysis_carterae.AAC.2
MNHNTEYLLTLTISLGPTSSQEEEITDLEGNGTPRAISQKLLTKQHRNFTYANLVSVRSYDDEHFDSAINERRRRRAVSSRPDGSMLATGQRTACRAPTSHAKKQRTQSEVLELDDCSNNSAVLIAMVPAASPLVEKHSKTDAIRMVAAMVTEQAAAVLPLASTSVSTAVAGAGAVATIKKYGGGGDVSNIGYLSQGTGCQKRDGQDHQHGFGINACAGRGSTDTKANLPAANARSCCRLLDLLATVPHFARCCSTLTTIDHMHANRSATHLLHCQQQPYFCGQLDVVVAPVRRHLSPRDLCQLSATASSVSEQLPWNEVRVSKVSVQLCPQG